MRERGGGGGGGGEETFAEGSTTETLTSMGQVTCLSHGKGSLQKFRCCKYRLQERNPVNPNGNKHQISPCHQIKQGRVCLRPTSPLKNS